METRPNPIPELALPDYQTLMLPFLQTVGGGQERSMDEIIELLAKVFNLSDRDRIELLPSGKQRTFYNRVGWARTYLKKAGLVETPGIGRVKITSRGIEVLGKHPSKIDRKFLMQFPEFVEFQKSESSGVVGWVTGGTTTVSLGDAQTLAGGGATISVVSQTPTESLEYNYRSLRSALADELLDRIKSYSPKFFENLVLDLLVAMGYGGSRQDAERVGRSGDGGIDGTINEDKLGLDVVYVQAKRWEGSVGRRPVAEFGGNLDPKKAKKGVFITTSQFTPDAKEYVKATEKRIVLVDGEELAQLMIDHNVGVNEVANYTVKKVDADYFSEG